MTTADATPAKPEVDLSTVRKAVAASSIGNAIEWFDFGVFTSGAMTGIIGTQFFPTSNLDTILSFALLAVSFIVRPFGGAFFGSLGDRFGRRKVLSTTILLMSGATFLIGVVPSYASIGVFAPILVLLVRLVQGFSTGGEYGGAATFMAEYAPTKRRGKYGSFLDFGTIVGYIAGNGSVLIVEVAAGTGALHDWAWRIPFWIALPLGLLGLYLRLRLEDTPAYRVIEQAGAKVKSPLREMFMNNRQMILKLFALVFVLNIADYLVLTYMPTYMTKTLGLGSKESTVIIIIIEVIMLFFFAPLGSLSDRIGRKPLWLAAAIGYLVLSFPAFYLMNTKSPVLLGIGFAIIALLLLLMLSVTGSTFPAMFPTKARYGSLAVGYNISTAIFGGTASLVVDSLVKSTGYVYWPAFYMMLAGAVAIIPIMRIPETTQISIERIGNNGEIHPEKVGAGE